MRFLVRMLTVFALLGGLAYGSYAFGKYVLSSRLFGGGVAAHAGSGLAAGQSGGGSALTRQVKVRGDKPSVEVQVLPADAAGQGPEPPSTEFLARDAKKKSPSPEDVPSSLSIERDNNRSSNAGNNSETGRRSTRATLGNREFDDADSLDYSLRRSEGRAQRSRNDERRSNDEDRPRRRRRRRSRSSSDESSSTRRRAVVEAPTRSESVSSSEGESSSGSSSDSASSEERPRSRRRRRERSSETRSESRSESRGEATRERDSPIPSPESDSGGSSSGGESPIPEPESQ